MAELNFRRPPAASKCLINWLINWRSDAPVMTASLPLSLALSFSMLLRKVFYRDNDHHHCAYARIGVVHRKWWSLKSQWEGGALEKRRKEKEEADVRVEATLLILLLFFFFSVAFSISGSLRRSATLYRKRRGGIHRGEEGRGGVSMRSGRKGEREGGKNTAV